jgi:hypothetical protein
VTDIFARLEERATGMRMPISMRKPATVEVESKKTGNVRPYTLDANEEYELTCTVRATFWANQAQHGQERRYAERALATLLYRDVLEVLARIEHAVSDGDANDALRWCGELRERISR